MGTIPYQKAAESLIASVAFFDGAVGKEGSNIADEQGKKAIHPRYIVL
ncbi:MAG: hypothetical protein GX299_07190 [Epulopiscium sp.]|nr:hypothetical protein [Candidatus Epulonipiscium sp.]